MNLDISGIIKGWDYDPSGVTARWIVGKDGKPKVQLRLDLGLFQMEVEGRPDGTQPRGFPSLLEYYLQAEKVAEEQKKPLALDAESCAELQQEAMQYYYRYLSFHSLRFYDGVVRDTEHNLTLFDLSNTRRMTTCLAVRAVLPLRADDGPARAPKAMGGKHYRKPSPLSESADDIRLRIQRRRDRRRQPGSRTPGLLHQVQKKKPKTAADKLRDELAHAIAVENYEHAAEIRDKLSKLDLPDPDA